MRVLFILIWAGAIFVFTCTTSFDLLIKSGVIRFEWDWHPRFSQFLDPLPDKLSLDFMLQKIGHIGAFFVLTGLLQGKVKSDWMILMLAFGYAALTEVLQLYFTRDGRLFDLGFDTVGILLSLGVGRYIGKSIPKQSSY